MSAAELNPKMETAQTQTPVQVEQRTMLLAIVIVAAQAPFLVMYGGNLWRFRPHYEFFPFVLVAFAWLAWRRCPRPVCPPSRSWRRFGHLWIAAGLFIMGVSILLYSPWLAATAVIVTIGGIFVSLGGRHALTALFPVWLLLWLIVYPPMQLDIAIIRCVQSVTSRSSSMLLDLLNVRHLQAGNVIQLPDRELFVAEACSGIHSHLLLIALCSVFAVLVRRTLLHAAFLIFSAIFWACVVNVARVTIVVVAANRNSDLVTGGRHEILGSCLVACGFFLVICTDQLLNALLAPVANDEDHLASVGQPRRKRWRIPRLDAGLDHANPLRRLWNWAVANPVHEPPNDGLELRNQEDDEGQTPSRLPLIVAFSLAFGCLGLLQLVILVQAGDLRTNGFAATGPVALAFHEASLSTEVDEWRRNGYVVTHRERGSDQGPCSQVWEYVTDGQSIYVSADYPFVGWHELTNSYVARGWQMVNREVREAATDLDANDKTASGTVASNILADGEYVEVQLRKPTGEYAVLMFGLFDRTGRPVVSRVSQTRWLADRVTQNPLFGLMGNQEFANSLTSTTIQVQQFMPSASQPDAEQLAATRSLFLRFRRELREQWRAQQQP